MSSRFQALSERKLNECKVRETIGVAGHRARDPPDPIPKMRVRPLVGNSEVKPCSVPGCSVVFGHANPGKLVAPLKFDLKIEEELPKIYN